MQMTDAYGFYFFWNGDTMHSDRFVRWFLGDHRLEANPQFKTMVCVYLRLA